MKFKYFVYIYLTAFLFLLILPNSTNAEQAGIKVAPATVTMIVEKSDTEKVAWVGIKNNYGASVNLTADLRGVDQEQGNLTPTKELPIQLKNNLELDRTNIELGPGESINLRLAIKDTTKLSPGGNYASLVIKQTGDKGSKIGLQPAISVSIFITKLEGAVKELDITNIKFNKLLFFMPSSVLTEFANNGNVIVIPKGRIDIISNKNKVASGIINEQSLGLLPGNKLYIKNKLKNNNIFESPGVKKMLIAYRYDGSDELKTISKSFLYVPIWLLLIPLILLAVYIFYKKNYKRKKKYKKTKSIDIKEESETTIFKFK